jgi:uncharacterized protein (TIGR02453 family)
MDYRDIYQYLEDLAQNNNRPWFQTNRERYDAVREQWLCDIDRTLTAMSEWEPKMAYLSAKDCAYRIYRDTRFSPDKTPYKTFLSAALSPYGRKTNRAGYYVQMDIRDDESGVYGGLWCPDSQMLRKLRNAIVDNIEEFEDILHEPDLQRLYPDWIGGSLKTIPKGWRKDHPQADLLRLTAYGKGHMVGRDFFLSPDWPARVANLLKPLKPLIDFLNYSLDEEL